MTWIKLDDAFDQHPKLLEVGPVAAWTFVRSLCYSNRNLTDGVITRAVARELAGSGRKGQRLVKALVVARLWEVRGSAYRIHDYLHYQPSRSYVEDLRRAKAEAGRAGGVRSGEARRSRSEAEREAAPKHSDSRVLKANGKQQGTPVPGPVPEPDRATSSLREDRRNGEPMRHVSGAVARVLAQAARVIDASEPPIP
jgi:hypothetical protein